MKRANVLIFIFSYTIQKRKQQIRLHYTKSKAKTLTVSSFLNHGKKKIDSRNTYNTI